MALQDKITQLWVKVTGRRIDPEEFDWLIGPIGDEDIIKDKFIKKLAAIIPVKSAKISKNSKER